MSWKVNLNAYLAFSDYTMTCPTIGLVTVRAAIDRILIDVVSVIQNRNKTRCASRKAIVWGRALCFLSLDYLYSDFRFPGERSIHRQQICYQLTDSGKMKLFFGLGMIEIMGWIRDSRELAPLPSAQCESTYSTYNSTSDSRLHICHHRGRKEKRRRKQG